MSGIRSLIQLRRLWRWSWGSFGRSLCRSRGRLLRRYFLHCFLDRRTSVRCLCPWGLYHHLFNSGLLPGRCGFLCRSFCLRSRRSLLSPTPLQCFLADLSASRTEFSFRFGGILRRPGGRLQTHGLLRPSDSSLRVLKHFSYVGSLAEYRSVTSDINASTLASRLSALFAFMTTPLSHVWRCPKEYRQNDVVAFFRARTVFAKKDR